jgi:hypothetical protein
MAKVGREAVEEMAIVADEKRPFHWELEFPEVFYSRRSGTRNAVERLENAGFDAVVGNPPYDELSEFYSDTSATEKIYLSESKPYIGFKNGRVNLYRLFILKGLQLLAQNGILSYIVPMSLLADDFSKPVREFLVDKNSIITIEAFPQKDDPSRRVFAEAKLSTCVVAVLKGGSSTQLTVTTHPAAAFEVDSPRYSTSESQLHSIFRHHLVIPTVSEKEWQVIQRTFGHADWPTLSEIADIYVGEIFDNAANQRFLADDPVGPKVVRGANLDRYLFRDEATQGAARYLREKLFVSARSKGEKAEHRVFERIGLQRGSAVDNWRRLIGAVVPGGLYCFDTVLLIRPRSVSLRVLLGILNSDLWEWRFRCTSTTNHVNEYELADLVIPPQLIDEKHALALMMQNYVDKVLGSDPLSVRRSEYQSVSADSIDKQIDRLIFEAYEVSQGDQIIIINSLYRQATVRMRSLSLSE